MDFIGAVKYHHSKFHELAHKQFILSIFREGFEQCALNETCNTFDDEGKVNDSIAAYQLTVYGVVCWLRH